MEFIKEICVICALMSILYWRRINTAAFGETCEADSDCSDANNECVIFGSCARGTCQCITGYGNADDSGCGDILSQFGETCGSGRICKEANQECNTTSGSCVCSTWYSYSSLARACTLVTYKLLTESCGGWWQEQCLLSDAEGWECGTTCACKDGYHLARYTSCRPPIYGERCLSSPDCESSFDTSTISDDTTNHAPVCSLNVCQCPPSHDHVVVFGHNLCISSPSANAVLKTNGETCTFFNECESHLCVKCPDESSGVCMADPSGATHIVYGRTIYSLAFILIYVSTQEVL